MERARSGTPSQRPCAERPSLAFAVPCPLRWECTVPGNPVAAGRPRFAWRGGTVHVHTPAKSAQWRALAVGAFRRTGPSAVYGGPVRVTLTAVMKRPARLPALGQVPHIARPDVDNLAKAALDALACAGILSDDSIVTDLRITKAYAARGEEPHLTVVIEKLQSEVVALTCQE